MGRRNFAVAASGGLALPEGSVGSGLMILPCNIRVRADESALQHQRQQDPCLLGTKYAPATERQFHLFPAKCELSSLQPTRQDEIKPHPSES